MQSSNIHFFPIFQYNYVRGVLFMEKTASSFLNNWSDTSEYLDAVFAASSLAQKAKAEGREVINATLGSLYNEQGQLYTFHTVYETYDRLSDIAKAKYASDITGNPGYRQAVFAWINRLNNISLPHETVAAAGGTGALILPLANTLNQGEAVLIPDVAWASYRSMIKQMNLQTETYSLMEKEKVSVRDLMDKAAEIMQHQHKVVVIINDPCHNPTGITLGKNRWYQLIDFFNDLSQQGPVIIINDIAYFDYSFDCDNVTDYMECFNRISDRIVINIAFSCSKTMTAYGMRTGANIILAQDQDTADAFANQYKRTARSFWSNVNNSMMDCFTEVITSHREEYLKEKQQAIGLLKKRSEIFLAQAKEAGLPLYPYQEGFFITLCITEQPLLNRYYEKLLSNDIYPVKITGGIRIAICGLTVAQCEGLAFRLRQMLDETVSEIGG